MSKIKGHHFRFLENGAAIPEETNVSITLTGNTEDTSTKDTTGLYQQQTVVSQSWSAQVDTFQGSAAQLRAILRKFNAAAAIAVGWDQTGGDENRVPQNANFKRSGQALLNDFTMKFDDRVTVATSLQFQGTGVLS
jgi:hypothetical protein